MPTPFSHLAAIRKLLTDEDVPADIRRELNAQHPAYLLGSIVPDARVENVVDSRSATHFYHYTEPYTKDPWRIMLDKHPQLNMPKDNAHKAFIAGYVAHLAMDQIWTENMLRPHFAHGDWGEDIKGRFFVLHLMLIDMDQRDLASLPGSVAKEICAAKPDHWLPFMPQDVVIGWQNDLYNQLKPDGASQTLEIFGARVHRTAEDMRRLVDDTAWMQKNLWDHVPRSILEVIEGQMYDHARQSLIAYMQPLLN
jgi:hypothetical protein